MTSPRVLQPGGSIVYTTKPVGLKTQLFLKGGAGGESRATWHIELCCKPDNDVELESEQPKVVDVSSAAGALVTVRNTGFREFSCWTDY